MKKLFVMLAAGAMFVACGGDKKAEEQKNDAAAPVAVEVAEEVPAVEVEAEADYIATAIELSERAMNIMATGDEAALDAIMEEMEAFDATLTPEQTAEVEEAVMQWAMENGYM